MLQGIPLRNNDVASMEHVPEIHGFDGINIVKQGKILFPLYFDDNTKNDIDEPIICAARIVSTSGTSVHDIYFSKNKIVRGNPAKYMFLTPYVVSDFSISIVIKTDDGFEYLYLDKGDKARFEWCENNKDDKFFVRRSFVQTQSETQKKHKYETEFTKSELVNLYPYFNEIFYSQ